MKAPVLVCLNLQRGCVAAGSPSYVPRAAYVLPSILACLGWARRQRLTVVHVHSADVAGEWSYPVAGCEPRVSEHLLHKRSRSFFLHRQFESGALRGRDALVVGFLSDRDGIAAAFDAVRTGARLAFISDAISASAASGQAPSAVDAVVNSILGDVAHLTHSADILEREFAIAPSIESLGLERAKE